MIPVQMFLSLSKGVGRVRHQRRQRLTYDYERGVARALWRWCANRVKVHYIPKTVREHIVVFVLWCSTLVNSILCTKNLEGTCERTKYHRMRIFSNYCINIKYMQWRLHRKKINLQKYRTGILLYNYIIWEHALAWRPEDGHELHHNALIKKKFKSEHFLLV